MKFISAKRPTDYANRLAEIKAKRRALLSEANDLKVEQEELEKFLSRASKGADFQFNGEDGYIHVLEWSPHERQDIDDDAVRRIFARLKKTVPTKLSTWTTSRIRYATEDE